VTQNISVVTPGTNVNGYQLTFSGQLKAIN